MTSPQDSPKRRKQKARRTRQLAEWREKQATKGATPTATSTTAKKKTSPKK